MTGPLRLGAVAYDPKVVTIWDGFRVWLRQPGLGLRLRPVLPLRATGGRARRWIHRRGMELAAGVGQDPANGPSATSLVMRDTDQDLVSVIVVPA